MQVVIGVDGCRGGWVFVSLENGTFVSAVVYKRFADGVDASGDVTVIGVDIPIGFPAPPAQRRAADGAARDMVRPLTSTVFPAPHPDVLTAPDWETARALSHKRTGSGLSKQSFALVPKMVEVTDIARQDNRVYEVHPEVSFRQLAGHRLVSKKHWNGHTERRALLAAAGILIPDMLEDAGNVAVDDILDSAVAAWSARRIAMGEAISLPKVPEYDDSGRQIAIWY